MNCQKCGAEFHQEKRAEAVICIFVMGDECIYSYYSCDNCGYYTIESYCDRFSGEEDIDVLQPVSREVGEKCVELIRACPNPRDKTCGCPSHKTLYYGTP